MEMTKINTYNFEMGCIEPRSYETSAERAYRLKNNKIIKEYLRSSDDILSGRVAPNRVMANIAKNHGKSIMGVKYILKQFGIYLSAKIPIDKKFLV